ncbi:hypothetical protein GWI33_021311 [Rhynchophorus ferrugineus]|uniref:Uncharacterized protein n=1 Tax=Rhynchophorus ferrugineus TaxID=354439 RepID=A0A834HPD1_RHYFE|nr:hypothetical protein GWI33_021311 [Rhynchophorus ferrugineus]
MGKIKLYMVWGSPPVNSVLMTAKALNIDIELFEVDFSKNEFLSDWFLKLNPAHTVPTLDDDGFILWDSHAILMYLVEKYGKNSVLYPEDSKTKAFINQILLFDCGTVFRCFSDCVKPLFYEGKKSMDQNKLSNLKDVYVILERILTSSKFLASDNITIADISILSTLLPSNLVLPIETNKFPKLSVWLEHMKQAEFYQAGEKALETFRIGFETVTRS